MVRPTLSLVYDKSWAMWTNYLQIISLLVFVLETLHHYLCLPHIPECCSIEILFKAAYRFGFRFRL
ncbi:MAG: hypothetical protein DMG22_06825 [Acidobacteria bacterium]|nr:MAG: hypothetical protein DMG22_06825 [Acidobacteriota bacterium]